MTRTRPPKLGISTPKQLLYSLHPCVERSIIRCRVENAKEIWDVLKTAHEGDEVTKITKRETIEGELGRFVLNKVEEPQAITTGSRLWSIKCATSGAPSWMTMKWSRLF
jgi:hypothetical protein